VRIFAFDLTGGSVSKQKTLLIFDWMGVQRSNRDGVTGRHYIEGAITGEYLQGIADILDDLITDFMSQDGVPTAVSSMEDMLALNNLLFVKTLLTAKKNPKKRISYFKQNIDKNYIEDFNKRVNDPVALLYLHSLGFDLDKWNDWHKKYVIDARSYTIDESAIKEFMSFMIQNWNDDWYDHPDKYNFESDGSLIYAPIILQPWFSPEFLVLHKYFPNVQNVH